MAQSWTQLEIIVVDDGSSDNTAEVAACFSHVGVRLIRQKNQGLAAARNTGLAASHGEFVVFLDADDRLLPTALQHGLECFQTHSECGFVFGGYKAVYANDNHETEVYIPRVRQAEWYLEFLRRNCVAMHGTVMFRRSVLLAVGGYDATLSAAEDYDVYLRVSSRFPVACHFNTVAEYWFHGSNMTGNAALMLKSTLRALGKQKRLLSSAAQQEAWAEGVRYWQHYYGTDLSKIVRGAIRDKRLVLASHKGWVLFRHAPQFFFRQAFRQGSRAVHRLAKSVLPASAQRLAQRALGSSATPPLGAVRFGDLRRLQPIDPDFGFNRGTPIDRYYIEGFLNRNCADIQGRVLEIGDSTYTQAFGAERVRQSDVLHVHAGNPLATFVGDLTEAPQIPSDTFDCFIFTQTLHLIYDFRRALQTIYRILKPGGVLLMTVPGITKIGDAEWSKTWHWSFTSLSVQQMLEEVFPAAQVQVQTYGNLLAAIAFLEGLAAQELPYDKLNAHDSKYTVTVAARALKSSST
jgi:glycosyltransferase involved in cell wall biosynthesis/SAM-dependent methyltransferase